MLPLLPLGIAALFGTAVVAKFRRSIPVSPQVAAQRVVIYDAALNQAKPNPDKLRELAAEFRKEGLPIEADALEKRAALAEASPEVKAERNAIFKKGMASKNAEAVREVAEHFDAMGATGVANKLRAHAVGLDAAKEIDNETPGEIPVHQESGQ